MRQRRRPHVFFPGPLADEPPPAEPVVEEDSQRQEYVLPRLIEDLRKYQAELEIQNKALRFSQREAEGASERFLTLFSSVPLALMVVDERSMVLESNAMALRLFRPKEEDPPLNFLMPYVNAAQTEKVEQAFHQARSDGSGEVSEVLFRTGSGDAELAGDLHIARIDNGEDDLAHFICAIVDQGPLLAQRRALEESATALRRRNEELHQSQNRLAAVINSSLDAIICVDAQHRITVFNPAAAALFQCPSVHAMGSALERFLPEAAQALGYDQVSTHAQLGEMEGRTSSGRTLAVEVSVSFEHRKDGDTITVFARDLTARKRIETQRNVLEAQLRESQKMQAVGTMAGGIAHDFNNILSAILGNVALAKQDAGTDSPALTSLLEIEKAGRRARDLVRQILTFSRNEPPRRSPILLADVVEETANLVRVTLPHMVELQVQITPDVPPVMADATQVEQALLNLCTNAIHAIGNQRGRITVTLDSTFSQTIREERRGTWRGHHVTLAVRDTGSGIDADTIDRIFEPFFTTKPVGQGTGLGLAVVHGIMQTHQGSVGVQSTPGKGSLFTLYFPPATHTEQAADPPLPASSLAPGAAPAAALPAPAAATEEPATQPPTAARGGDTSAAAPRLAGPAASLAAPRTPPVATVPRPASAPSTTPSITPPVAEPSPAPHVMYVDDDEALVFLVQRALSRRGMRVSTFTDPQQASAVLRERAADFDLLVTDYNMPGFCGVDLLREARQLRPDLPVALASGYITAEIEKSALAEGAGALIHKPNDVDELCNVVQQLLARPASAH